MKKKKIAILTGGGDCSGLNAVILAVVKTAILKYNYEVIGYKFGYRGLYNNDFIKLDLNSVSGISHKGGTILYSSNKDNLFDYLLEENGEMVKKDVSQVAIDNLKKEGVDTLIVIGGDGTLTSANDFYKRGINVVGVPKTIDNDLSNTDFTFGFFSCVDTVSESLGKLHTTGESHHRVMVCEVMGRNAGWIALYGGLSGSSDVILIPEIPYDINKIVDKINERDKQGKPFTIITVAEGCKSIDGKTVIKQIVKDSPDPIRLGGIAEQLTQQLEHLVPNHEIRSLNLGHLQRGGDTAPFDRILSSRYGVKAVELASENIFGQMVCLKGNEITYIPIEDAISKTKLVKPASELVNVAKCIGISFGD